MKKIKNAYQNKHIVVLFVAFLLALIFFIPMGILKSFSAHASSIDNAEKVNEISESNKEVKTVLDNNVKDSKILYNYDSSPDYIYVELLDGGYAVFSAYSNELIEYSPYDIDILDDKLDNDSATIIYGGPATYLSAINKNMFVDINTDETITIETAEINNLSALSRSLFNDVNTINNRKLFESNYTANIQEKIE
ncbi:MAG: hypothetical protein K2L42_06865 [Clostridia bacterium]|nr:hypothetical protein [Clostridia bacterium]